MGVLSRVSTDWIRMSSSVAVVLGMVLLFCVGPLVLVRWSGILASIDDSADCEDYHNRCQRGYSAVSLLKCITTYPLAQ